MLHMPTQEYMKHIPLFDETVLGMSMRNWGISNIRFFVKYSRGEYTVVGFTVDRNYKDKNIFTVYFRAKSCVIITKKNKKLHHKFVLRNTDEIDFFHHSKGYFQVVDYNSNKKWNLLKKLLSGG